MSYKRYPIFDGDMTTAGAGCKVISPPMAVPMTYNGRHATFEGDKIWCEACKSHGAAKCIPPMRPNTSADGRQRVLSDDLCICKCPKPPRLVASIKTFSIDFENQEISGIPGSGFWANLTDSQGLSSPELYSDRYKLVDIDGAPMPKCEYAFQMKSGTILYGVTDANGFTEFTSDSLQEDSVKIYIGNWE